jgi:hypothetical protein
MCAFPNTFEPAERFSRNTRNVREQCGGDPLPGAEKSAATASIAAAAGRFRMQKLLVLLAFPRWHGVC